MERQDSIDEVLGSALSAWSAFVGELDVDVLDGSSALALLRKVSGAKSSLSACETLLARRVETSNAHILTGCSSASQVVASVSGVSQRDAAQTLETARRLEGLPDTEARFRSGELSASQVAQVARAAEVDPSSEARLLALAHRDSVRSLPDEARRVVAAGREDAAEAAYRKRYLRVTRVGEHSVELHGRFATADFMWVDAVLQPLAKRAFMEARSSGRRLVLAPIWPTDWSRWPSWLLVPPTLAVSERSASLAGLSAKQGRATAALVLRVWLAADRATARRAENSPAARSGPRLLFARRTLILANVRGTVSPPSGSRPR